jgi:hypothetical protein
MSTQERFARFLRSTNSLMAAVFLLIGVANIVWAERSEVADGLGWDGVIYASWVKDFQGVLTRGVANYYTARVLPSAIVHYGMRLLSIPLENRNIILSFDVYNLVLLCLSAYVWGLIGDKLSVGDRGKWLGFCLLFLNYANLKQVFYLPVQIDTTAFTFGFLTLYFFLTDNRAGTLIVILLGGLVWPTVPLMAALLYVLPYRREDQPMPASPHSAPRIRWSTFLAAAVSASTLIMLLDLTAYRLPERIAYFPRILRIDSSLIYLSVAVVPIYLFLTLRAAADEGLFDVRRLLAAIRWKRAAAAVVALLVVGLVRHAISNGVDISWGSPKSFFIYTLLSSLTEPLIFLIAHVVYFGPAILLLVFFWRPFCEALNRYGIGLRILVLLNLLLSINPQSRYEINVLPIFVAVLVVVLIREMTSWRSFIFWALLCLAYSKVWCVFNTAPQVDDGTMDVLLKPPLQNMFMNIGPWMSRQMYFVQAVAVALTALLIYFVALRNRKGRRASSAALPHVPRAEA